MNRTGQPEAGAGAESLAASLRPLVGSPDLAIELTPADLDAEVISFDEEAIDWLEPLRYGDPRRWGGEFRATQHALVFYEDTDSSASAPWSRYLAFYRHGGIGYSARGVWSMESGRKEVPLGKLVGLVWALVELQARVAEDWAFERPGSLRVGLWNLLDSHLGDFGAGWADADSEWWGSPLSPLEDTASIVLPIGEDLEPVRLAATIGDRIENIFGTTARRYTLRAEPGEIDPRLLWPVMD